MYPVLPSSQAQLVGRDTGFRGGNMSSAKRRHMLEMTVNGGVPMDMMSEQVPPQEARGEKSWKRTKNWDAVEAQEEFPGRACDVDGEEDLEARRGPHPVLERTVFPFGAVFAPESRRTVRGRLVPGFFFLFAGRRFGPVLVRRACASHAQRPCSVRKVSDDQWVPGCGLDRPRPNDHRRAAKEHMRMQPLATANCVAVTVYLRTGRKTCFNTIPGGKHMFDTTQPGISARLALTDRADGLGGW
ncbi:hypothetical protein K456DRAFT_1757354 [Colletotrichum gloeosporioides 23]|nr:hypothetical protein K456DRAFT_1757354 [Colletotrichum gloeosporioides 23]